LGEVRNVDKKVIFGSITSLGLMFGVVDSQVVAQMSHENYTTQFQRINQPLWLKGAVTTGGLTLIGLNIWWFLLSKPKSQN
jgi:plastocyanin domain-containing protein